MTQVSCVGDGILVEPALWLPDQLFDYAWTSFGCNHLVCGQCGQLVRSEVLEDRLGRHYECACQARDEYGLHWLGSDNGRERGFETSWHCAGHPPLDLPVTLDGIEISDVGPVSSIVSRTLTRPPFLAPGFAKLSFWVQRLYWLMVSESQRAQVGHAVAAHLASGDPLAARSALEFFRDVPSAAGADQVANLVTRDRARLLGTPDPDRPSVSLYARALETIEARISIVKKPVDRVALEVARASLLRGEADDALILAVVRCDPHWVVQSAADLVRARPARLPFVLQALTHVPATELSRSVAALRAIDEETGIAVGEWMERKGLSVD